jgi:hypothetical protein
MSFVGSPAAVIKKIVDDLNKSITPIPSDIAQVVNKSALQFRISYLTSLHNNLGVTERSVKGRVRLNEAAKGSSAKKTGAIKADISVILASIAARYLGEMHQYATFSTAGKHAFVGEPKMRPFIADLAKNRKTKSGKNFRSSGPGLYRRTTKARFPVQSERLDIVIEGASLLEKATKEAEKYTLDALNALIKDQLVNGKRKKGDNFLRTFSSNILNFDRTEFNKWRTASRKLRKKYARANAFRNKNGLGGGSF